MAWQEVAINLIGPWTFTVNGASYTFRALTMIDTVTNYCELIRIDNKSAAHVGQKFETNGFHGILVHSPASMTKAMNSWASGSNNIYIVTTFIRKCLW